MDNGMFLEQQVPAGLLTSIQFSILTEAEIEKHSVIAIDAINDVTNPKLGVPNLSSQCSTCGASDVRNCDGHYGIIKFPIDILHPYFISETVQFLNKICPGCKSIRDDFQIKGSSSISRKSTLRNTLPKGCKYCVEKTIGWYPKMKFKISSKDSSGKIASVIVVEVNEKMPKKFRNKNLSEVLPTDYWDFIQKDPLQDKSSWKLNTRTLSPAQVYYLMKDVDPKFIEKLLLRPDSLFLTCFPVTPNCNRVMETMHMFSKGQKLVFDERTRAYKRLVDFKRQADELGLRVRDCLNISKLNTEKSTNSDSKSGLKWIKEVVLGKRTDHAFRMTVVGDPNIKFCEIGVPLNVSERLQISENLNTRNWEKLNACCNMRLLEKGEFYVRRKGDLVCVRHMNELQIGDTVYRPLDEGDILLVNRPPSVHQHSLIALFVKVLPINSVVSLNPVCCSPLRGDFDGDCLHGYIPQSIESRVELRELVGLNHQLVNGQNGRNLLSLCHDSLTAAYLLREKGVFLNRFQMQQLEMLCSRQLLSPAIIKAPPHQSPMWTGEQLLSMLLPQCFDFSFPSNGVYISNGEIISSSLESTWLQDTDGNIFSSLVQHYGSKALDILFSAQEVLLEWLSMRGFSVSLSDFYLSSDSYSRKKLMEEVSYGLQEVERMGLVKQLMVDPEMEDILRNSEENENAKLLEVGHAWHLEKKAILNKVSIGAFREVFRDLQNLVHQYASKDNSLLAMVKAGSKGSLLKLVQQGLCLGLQHSSVPLSFRIPCKLSCAMWNHQKVSGLHLKVHDSPELRIPYAVVGNSFINGLNPIECFVHSMSCRNSSFSENADLPGTLTRKLMFYMRDLYIAYDGTVRNAYGNQLVQFSYGIPGDTSIPDNDTRGVFGENIYGSVEFGSPVGSLAACSISEAAYSALDQPINRLETSSLLNLKKVLETGNKKTMADRTISLFLSKKLERWLYGYEYGAIIVKSHLERVLFSDVVSTVMIIFSQQSCRGKHFSPWICHFHICKERIKRRGLDVQSVIDALNREYTSTGKKLKVNLPKLQILSRDCSIPDTLKENDGMLCISVAVEILKGSVILLDTIRDLVVPFFLGSVIKGVTAFKKVDILWNDLPNASKSRRSCPGELYLKVFVSGNSKSGKLWNLLLNASLEIMDLIDWERSHPDSIYDIFNFYGIDAARKYFLRSLMSTVSDIGKTILPEHLLLVADFLSGTGEFLGLNVKGITKQRDLASVSSPFMQACFSNPGDCFIKAAKKGAKDNLVGTLDAVAWGKEVPVGTGGQFDILYSGKGCTLDKPVDVFHILHSESSPQRNNKEVKIHADQKNMYGKCAPSKCISSPGFRRYHSLNDVTKLSITLRDILHKYSINQFLSEADKSVLMDALHFHPQSNEKMGTGPQDIKIGKHPKHQKSRCFMLVRTDGTEEDFSYRKCVMGAARAKNISPQFLERLGIALFQTDKY